MKYFLAFIFILFYVNPLISQCDNPKRINYSNAYAMWCGDLDDNGEQTGLGKQELYFEFTNEYPDYAPKSKMTISRTKFYKWLHSYCIYKLGYPPEEGRDLNGRWIILKSKPEDNVNNDTEYIEF